MCQLLQWNITLPIDGSSKHLLSLGGTLDSSGTYQISSDKKLPFKYHTFVRKVCISIPPLLYNEVVSQNTLWGRRASTISIPTSTLKCGNLMSTVQPCNLTGDSALSQSFHAKSHFPFQLYAAFHCIKNLASYPDLKTEASTNFVNDAQHVMIFSTGICIGRSSAYMFYPMGNPQNINLTINGEYIYILCFNCWWTLGQIQGHRSCWSFNWSSCKGFKERQLSHYQGGSTTSWKFELFRFVAWYVCQAIGL